MAVTTCVIQSLRQLSQRMASGLQQRKSIRTPCRAPCLRQSRAVNEPPHFQISCQQQQGLRHALYASAQLATGRIPGILIPTFEMACGAHFISDWLATSAGRMVIPMPTGRKATEAELLQISEDCAASMRKLAAFYADPSKADTTELMELLQRHLEQVAFHHHNVGRYQTPELEFGA